MKLSKLAIFPLAFALLLASGGSMAAPEHTEVLAQVDTPTVLVLDGETFYVVEDHGAIQLWRESNGVLHGGQHNRLTEEETGLQILPFCLMGDGTLTYLEADDHGHHKGEEEEHECEGVVHEADTRITNGYLVNRARELLP